MPAEAESIGFLLARIHNNMDRQANNNLKSSGMTFSQMRILYYLLKHGEAPPSQKDIEDFLQVSHPTVAVSYTHLDVYKRQHRFHARQDAEPEDAHPFVVRRQPAEGHHRPLASDRAGHPLA